MGIVRHGELTVTVAEPEQLLGVGNAATAQR